MVRGYGKGKFASDDQREAVMAKLKGKGRGGSSSRTSDAYDGYEGRRIRDGRSNVAIATDRALKASKQYPSNRDGISSWSKNKNRSDVSGWDSGHVARVKAHKKEVVKQIKKLKDDRKKSTSKADVMDSYMEEDQLKQMKKRNKLIKGIHIKKPKRWAYGTRDKKWHLIGSEDRDYEKAIPQAEMKAIGKEAAKRAYLGPRIIGKKYHIKATKQKVKNLEKDIEKETKKDVKVTFKTAKGQKFAGDYSGTVNITAELSKQDKFNLKDVESYTNEAIKQDNVSQLERIKGNLDVPIKHELKISDGIKSDVVIQGSSKDFSRMLKRKASRFGFEPKITANPQAKMVAKKRLQFDDSIRSYIASERKSKDIGRHKELDKMKSKLTLQKAERDALISIKEG